MALDNVAGIEIVPRAEAPFFGSNRHIALINYGMSDRDGATSLFIKEGLERRQLCLYLHDEKSEAAVVSSLAAFELEAAPAIAAGQLRLADARTAYLAGGRFDPNAMLASLQETVDLATGCGFEGLFATGEMSWSLGPHPGTLDLMAYEALCDGFYAANPAVGLCQYDRRRFDDRAICRVLLTHPWVLIGGRLCRNFHHVPASEVRPLGEEDLALDVDQVLADLVVRDAAESMVASAAVTIEGDSGADLTIGDARRMVTIYGELEEFKLDVLARAERRASFLAAVRPRAHRDDVVLQLRGELLGLRQRLAFWKERLREMVDVDHDTARRLVRFNDRSVRLSRRESQLIEALIAQRGQAIAVPELLRRAWGDGHRSEGQLRNYVVQLRKKLALLGIPAALVTEPGAGYSLRFDFSGEAAASPALAFVEPGSSASGREPFAAAN